MDSTANILQFCRLCLVKDGVNIPIFDEQGDIRQIYLKISSCLPVKVAREDHLPKKICDGCSNKLDICYDFWRTSAESEKQLLAWLGATGKDAAQVNVKEEDNFDEPLASDISKNDDDENKCYMFEQKVEEGPPVEINDEPPPSKRPRRTAAVKAAIAMDQNSDDDGDSGEPITKMEDDSDETDGDDREPAFVDVPSTSADDQPGPSGVSKDGSDAPEDEIDEDEEEEEEKYDSEPDWKPPTKKMKTKLRTRKRKITIKKEPKEKAVKEPKEKRPPRKAATKNPVFRVKPNQKARSWCCKLCFEEFETRKNLEYHRRTMHEESETLHPECTFEKYSFDEVHEFYTCNTCSAEFQDKEEVEKHVETHEERYDCEVCGETVKGALNFSCHMQPHREDNLFPCPLCPHTTGRKSAMLTHISRLHFRKYDFQCRMCGKCFNDATTFKEHENFHLGIKPFICVVCSREFIYSRYLIAHQIRNHRVRVLDKDSKTQCHMCTKIFARSETLVKHMLNKHLTYHEGPHEKKHLCDVCGQGFSRTDKLKIHYRKHTGEKPYSCVYCSKSFIKRDYLIMHERIHNGEKPYVCDYCGKCFNQGAPLRIHMRSHTGERPYKCPHCETGCISKGALNAHVKSCLNTL